MSDIRPDIMKESRLLRYASRMDTHMTYMRKLISLINVENLTQVLNRYIRFLPDCR